MLHITKWEVQGFEPAIRGMRNPLDSWSKSDSRYVSGTHYELGENDLDLACRLASAGSDHGKFLRMIVAWMDISAPLYWWKEFDTYKVGTVANSCSTMHTIHKYPFTLDMFAHENMNEEALNSLNDTIDILNGLLNNYRQEKDAAKKKDIWYSIIQLLPTSFIQKRTVMMNYETLAQICLNRRHHKLDEWKQFVYSVIIAFPYLASLTDAVSKRQYPAEEDK